MRIPFSKQYIYITNHLHLQVTNYRDFVCTITLILLTMCLIVVNASISSNATSSTIVISGHIRTCPVDLFLLFHCIFFIFNFQPKAKIKKLRNIYEDALREYGTNNTGKQISQNMIFSEANY